MQPGRIDLDGRAALVTGASRGIGRAIARAFAACGACIALHHHRAAAAAEQTLADLAGSGHLLLKGDLADPDVPARLVDRTVAGLGGLDILVNNAGIYDQVDPRAATPTQWTEHLDRTLQVNLHGPARLMHCAAPHLRAAGGGHVVNISSRGAFRGEPTAPAYGASKAGLNALSQSLAQAWGPDRIFVTVIAPGFVETDMTTGLLAGRAGEAIRAQSPLDRVARPEEVAEVALFLVSGRADYLTGAVVDLNGASYLR